MPLRSFALRTAPRLLSGGLILACALGTASVQAQPQPASAAPIEVRTPRGLLAPAPAAWRTPAAARLHFVVQGKIKSLPYQTQAQLDWLPQGTRYEAAQEVQIPLLGSRRQSSTGTIGPAGLQPDIFMDRTRREYSTTFDAQAGQIVFSRGSTPAPWVLGTQDRLSVFFQLAGMLAAAPRQYPVGTQITLSAASSSRVAPWTFTVRGTETLQLPAGTISALKLEHNADTDSTPPGDGLQSALWLAPSMQYLPVRIRMVEDGGRDELDLKLQSRSQP